MKLLLDTLMIFFGTLAVAALVALGEPADPPAVPAPVHASAGSIAPR